MKSLEAIILKLAHHEDIRRKRMERKNSARRNGNAIPRPRPQRVQDDGLYLWCSGCDQMLHEESFHYAPRMSGKRRHQCKQCLKVTSGRGLRQQAIREGDLTTRQWRAILEANSYRCFHCGSGEDITLDHFLPIARGGRHTAANVVPACGSCNLGRRDSTVAEWLNGGD